MTRVPDLVEVVCVRCGTISTVYLRPRPGGEPGTLAEAPEDELVCPECGALLGSDETLAPDTLGTHPAC